MAQSVVGGFQADWEVATSGSASEPQPLSHIDIRLILDKLKYQGNELKKCQDACSSSDVSSLKDLSYEIQVLNGSIGELDDKYIQLTQQNRTLLANLKKMRRSLEENIEIMRNVYVRSLEVPIQQHNKKVNKALLLPSKQKAICARAAAPVPKIQGEQTEPRFSAVKPFCQTLSPSVLGGLSASLDRELTDMMLTVRSPEEAMCRLNSLLIENAKALPAESSDPYSYFVLPLMVCLYSRLGSIVDTTVKEDASKLITNVMGRLICANLQGVFNGKALELLNSDVKNDPPLDFLLRKIIAFQFGLSAWNAGLDLDNKLLEPNDRITLNQYLRENLLFLCEVLRPALNMPEAYVIPNPFANQVINYVGAKELPVIVLYQLADALRFCLANTGLGSATHMRLVVKPLTEAFVKHTAYFERFSGKWPFVDERAMNENDFAIVWRQLDPFGKLRNFKTNALVKRDPQTPVEAYFLEAHFIQYIKDASSDNKKGPERLGMDRPEFNKFATMVLKSMESANECQSIHSKFLEQIGKVRDVSEQLSTAREKLRAQKAELSKTEKKLHDMENTRQNFAQHWSGRESPLKKLFVSEAHFEAFADKHLRICSQGLKDRLSYDIPVASSYYVGESLFHVFDHIYGVLNQPQFCRPEAVTFDDQIIRHKELKVGHGFRLSESGEEHEKVLVLASKVSGKRSGPNSGWVLTHVSPVAGTGA